MTWQRNKERIEMGILSEGEVRKSHPIADLFPLLEGKEFEDLKADIQEHGQLEPIWVYEGMILDGRNRYRACIELNIVPHVQIYSGQDPSSLVISLNLHRRHLNESQRALIAARLVTDIVRSQVQENKNENNQGQICQMSSREAADLLNVARRTVDYAKKVLEEGTQEEVSDIQKGKAAVSTIAKEIRSKKPSAKRKHRRETPMAQRGKNPERIERKRLNAKVWAQVRDALINLTSLPLAADVVSIVKSQDRSGIVNARLFQSIKWLKEFANEWNSNKDRRAS